MRERPAPPFEVRLSRRLLSLITAFACVAGIAACSENLESGSGCPVLCPQTPVELRDTIIDAVLVDTTLAGFPALGFEEHLLLANRGDTLETRVVVRFDSLPTEFTPPGTATPIAITSVDSLTLRMRLVYPLDNQRVFTLQAYDVDTLLPPGSAADTSVATLAPLFRPDRLLGTMTVVPTALEDSTIHLQLAGERLLAKISGPAETRRLRIGLAIAPGASASVRLAGQGDASMLSVRFRVSPDTTVPPIVLLPQSRTPTGDPFLAPALADYQVVFRGTPLPPGERISVGGAPAQRTYLQFQLPSQILDSTRIVRAALLLTQAPNPASAVRTDTVVVFPDVVVADSKITSLERLMRFTSRTFLVGPQVMAVPPLRLVPADSGERSVEMVGLLAAWSLTPSVGTPRALVLRVENEGQVGGTIQFFSTRAPAAVRPRLRLTYAPKLEFGLP